jgi:hypothetical protein
MTRAQLRPGTDSINVPKVATGTAVAEQANRIGAEGPGAARRA